jgi:hypothetical protein
VFFIKHIVFRSEYVPECEFPLDIAQWNSKSCQAILKQTLEGPTTPTMSIEDILT